MARYALKVVNLVNNDCRYFREKDGMEALRRAEKYIAQNLGIFPMALYNVTERPGSPEQVSLMREIPLPPVFSDEQITAHLRPQFPVGATLLAVNQAKQRLLFQGDDGRYDVLAYRCDLRDVLDSYAITGTTSSHMQAMRELFPDVGLPDTAQSRYGQ